MLESKLLHTSRLVVLIAMFFASSTACKAYSDIHCHVSDPKDPTLNIRETPGGKIISEIENEMLVRLLETKSDGVGKRWAKVSGSVGKNQFEGYMFLNSLRCFESEHLRREFITLDALRSTGLVPEGIDVLPDKFGPTLPVACPVVPNGWGMTFSHQLVEAYRRRGFSLDAMCLGFGGWGVYYDPETGRRLPLYEMRGTRGELRPLWLPDCFKSARMKSGMMGGEIGWVPTGCTIKFHPTTGIPITRPDLVELGAGGPAGPDVDEDNQSSTISDERLKQLVYGH